jgi:hypothetical protein
MNGTRIDQELGDRMVDWAIARCAEEHFAGDVRRARHALLRGDCRHCSCVNEGLILQLSNYIGRVAGSVRAIYAVRPEGKEAPDEGSEHRPHGGIHLVVWVERKSPALKALAGTLDAVLGTTLRKLGCPIANPECYALDVDLVDDRDVSERRGFGMLVHYPRLGRSQAWKASPEQLPIEQPATPGEVSYTLPESFDPELIPEDRLIEHALTIERMPAKDRALLEHHLTELKVTLIRRLISDRLEYINIAKRWFDVADLGEIYRHRIGFGKIGGKSAGMLLAGKMLRQVAGDEIRRSVSVPESYFMGSDLMYIFMAMNGLMHWNDEKYRSEEQIHDDFPQIQQEFEGGRFPPEIRVELETMLAHIGSNPLIVRSSSQLEDSLGTSFAGKYNSYFCPNQGTPDENLKALILAISRTYASTFRPDALLYRRSRGLQDYDERMAILIQAVEGERWGRFYAPFAAGVGFSRNSYRWAPQIRMEDGFVRLVWGLGTRAVERVGDDYPRLVALSHPRLQPDDTPEAIRRYSQQFIDLIDLEEGCFKTLPISQVLDPNYPHLRYLAQIEQDGYFSSLQMLPAESDIPRLAITFERFLSRTDFPALMREVMQLLEQHWGMPVDVEFAVDKLAPGSGGISLALLQCRPLPGLKGESPVRRPESLEATDVVMSSRFIVPDGFLRDIRYVLFVVPDKYFALPSEGARRRVGRVVSRINAVLPPKSFICVGPGRWGTENLDLGVLVGYADICNASALVELSGKAVGPAPEPSLGTHFFHDLLEAQIYPIAANLDSQDTIFLDDFFLRAENSLSAFVSVEPSIGDALRLIDVGKYRAGHHLEVIMQAEKGLAVAYLAGNEKGAGARELP